jgi:hypothetical protein
MACQSLWLPLRTMTVTQRALALRINYILTLMLLQPLPGSNLRVRDTVPDNQAIKIMLIAFRSYVAKVH